MLVLLLPGTISVNSTIFSHDSPFSEMEFSTSSMHIRDISETVEVPSVDQVIFFEDLVSLEEFVQVYEVEKIYGNLQAVKISNLEQPFSQINGVVSINSFTSFQSLPLHQAPVSNFETNVTGIFDLNNMGFTGTNITIGVLDNGINFNHPLLASKFGGEYFAGLPTTPSCGSHGTPVSGLISGSSSGSFRGMAPDSKLYDIAFSCTGPSIDGDFLAAFDHVIAMNDTISVINTSFGGFAPTWDPVIRQVVESGIVVVGSAGNSGSNYHSASAGGPGNSIHGISVGAIDDDMELTSFSSVGPSHELTYKPDLLAPGMNVPSTSVNGDISTFTGTSFSSPIVAGGVATLIDALQYYNISHNPGLIKASLLETAKSIGIEALRQGRGIAQFNLSLDLILDQNTPTPKLVSFGSQSSPIKYLEYFPRGMEIKLPVSLVSSHPEEVVLSFGGDFAGKSIDYSVSSSYSQQLELTLDSTQFSANSAVNGTITAVVGNYSVTLPVNFEVGNNVVGTIGIDRVHTYWDQFGGNHLGGSNIGTMIELAMQQDFDVVEINERYQSSTLEALDIIWLPDPINLVNQTSLYDERFRESGFTQDEVNILDNFINSGKSVFVTTLGYQQDRSGNSQFGLNTVAFNNIFGNYGIEAFSEPVFQNVAGSSSPLRNISSLVGSAEAITHAGNYLAVSNSAWSLGGYGNKSTLAYYQDPNSRGKVLISSTNYWMDNRALGTGYFSDNDDSILSSNVWSWLMSNNQLIKLSQEVNDNTIAGSFEIPEGLNSNSLSMKVEDTTNSMTSELTWTEANNIYSFDYQFENEGEYTIIAEVEDEYIGWHHIRDISGPEIIPGAENGSNFAETSFQVLNFEVYDSISGIDLGSLELRLNNELLEVVTSYNELQQELRVIVPATNIAPSELQILELQLADNLGNYNSIQFHFTIGGALPTSSSQAPSSSISSDEGFLKLLSPYLMLLPVLVVIVRRTKISRIC